MLISDDEYIIFKNWMREYIDRNCIMRLGKDNWPEIDGREIGDGKPGATTLRFIKAFRKKVSIEGTML